LEPTVFKLQIAGTLLAVSAAAGCAPTSPPVSTGVDGAGTTRLMAPGELEKLPSQAADRRVAYGPHASQYGELRIPAGPGPHPVVILIHGGCFKAAYATLRDLAPMADALKEIGVATWNIEYRRLGEPGAGWPETYLDVGRAVDHLRELASQHALDLGRVVVAGHSAGGHLAMWAAARDRMPSGSDLHVAKPLSVRAVLNLAGPLDLATNIAGYEVLCRDNVVTTLMGGVPANVPDRYAHASAKTFLPLRIPQVVLIGDHEEFVPRPLAEAYVQAAREAGDSVQLIVMPDVGHFEIASPHAGTWPRVSSVIRALLDGALPDLDVREQR
jgi:acetyl esterase/lipase